MDIVQWLVHWFVAPVIRVQLPVSTPKIKGKILKFREIVEKIVLSKTLEEQNKWYEILRKKPFWMNPKEK